MQLSKTSEKREQLLHNKTALIIGGAGYIGAEISQIFLENGATVIVASRNEVKFHTLFSRLKNQEDKTRLHFFEVDITSDTSVAHLSKKIDERFKSGIDILVNCGWSGKKNSLDSITMDDWNYDIEVCLTGVFRTIQKFLPSLKNNQGNILNIASMYGHVAPNFKLYDGDKHVNPPSYGAAKAGVIQLTKYLASFLSEHNVRVNCISPGAFPFETTQENDPSFIDKLAKMAPLGRIGQPQELKGISLLLCSEWGSYINGQNICVDGGWTIW
jgi:NAD(P)-dependent dehydrogenase (short-subunit alcohol dehydrogenase family)